MANRENRRFRSPTPRGFQHPIWHEPARRGAIPLGQPREPAFLIAHAKRFPAPDLGGTGQTGAIPLGQPREPAFLIAHTKTFPVPDLARTGTLKPGAIPLGQPREPAFLQASF
ncbi:MAG: hypothetical protein KME26_09455 [Oscillatoria princeps RMCB-10]|nr:hypothetical protein [Oscillatoria princeps RMCB-10]